MARIVTKWGYFTGRRWPGHTHYIIGKKYFPESFYIGGYDNSVLSGYYYFQYPFFVFNLPSHEVESAFIEIKKAKSGSDRNVTKLQIRRLKKHPDSISVSSSNFMGYASFGTSCTIEDGAKSVTIPREAGTFKIDITDLFNAMIRAYIANPSSNNGIVFYKTGNHTDDKAEVVLANGGFNLNGDVSPFEGAPIGIMNLTLFINGQPSEITDVFVRDNGQWNTGEQVFARANGIWNE